MSVLVLRSLTIEYPRLYILGSYQLRSGQWPDRKLATMKIPLDQISTPYAFRNPVQYSPANLAALKLDIKTRGQLDDADVEKINGEYRILTGHSRYLCISQLATEGAICDATSKPFTTFSAKVHENLSDVDRAEMLVDESQRQPLDRPGYVKAAVLLILAGVPDKRVVIQLHKLYEQFGNSARKTVPVTEDGGQDLFNKFKGAFQGHKAIAASPTMLRDAHYKFLAGELLVPRLDDVKTLEKVYRAERDADPLKKINADNPGPLFLAAWEKLQEEGDAAAQTGNAVKPISMMNREQVEKMSTEPSSRIIKLAMLFVLRKRPAEQFPTFNTFVTGIENALSPEQVTMLDSLFV